MLIWCTRVKVQEDYCFLLSIRDHPWEEISNGEDSNSKVAGEIREIREATGEEIRDPIKAGEINKGLTKDGETNKVRTRVGETNKVQIKAGEIRVQTKVGETNKVRTRVGEISKGLTKAGETNKVRTKAGEITKDQIKDGEITKAGDMPHRINFMKSSKQHNNIYNHLTPQKNVGLSSDNHRHAPDNWNRG